MAKRRVDALLVERGLAPSTEKARALIMAGAVRVGEEMPLKPGSLASPEASLRVVAPPTFVSRGGQKLTHALDAFHLEVEGKVALDVGASTGGFTDCLLQRGARRVYALDVGYGQLDYRLRTDPRVVVMERVNARYPFDLPEAVDLATMDVSFISVEKVIPALAGHLKAGGCLLVLLKPQFELPRGSTEKKGVVRDPRLHAQALARFLAWAGDEGWLFQGVVPSPLLGAAGNREFLALLEKPGAE
ncbi:MAG: TlyA family RNA methyltransferase [Chloroflexi bacterium]|nr:TlyA family RNA methyltransferase [Chloroflexota bacterium]